MKRAEDECFEIWDGEELDSDGDEENAELDSDNDDSRKMDNSAVTGVEEDISDAENVIVDLIKENNFTMSKLAEGCHDVDILKYF